MNQSLSLIDGPSISLDQMLQARDGRAQNQQLWLVQYKVPLISLTLVIPGAIKQSSGAHYLFEKALHCIESLCDTQHFPIINKQDFSSVCGYEALLAVQANAELLKTHCIHLETTHPLGRLWDIDIICPHEGILSRRTKALAVRRCLVCQQEAHVCARSKKHGLLEVTQAIEEIIHAASC